MASKQTPKINVGEFPYIDIMPLSRREVIEKKVAKQKWIKFVTIGAIVAVILSAGAGGFRFLEQFNHDKAASDQAAVEKNIDTFSEVDDALTIRDSVTDKILNASASSVEWEEIISRITSNLPSDSVLTSLEVQTGGITESEPAIAVLVSISSSQPIAYSKVLESFGNIDGLVDGSLKIGNLFAQGSVENGDSKYIYPVAFSIDNTVLANIFSYLDPAAETSKAADSSENNVQQKVTKEAVEESN